MSRPSPLRDYVNELQARGQYVFRKEEAAAAIQTGESALGQALYRLSKTGRIARIRKDFYVIVPLEYRRAKLLPVPWFIDSLMNSLRQEYYVGLLSAASLHGAGHQRPREFQVVIRGDLRPITVPGLRVAFITNSDIANVPVTERKVETGSFRLSTPEATALDLVRYPSHAGGLGNVATVLAELSESMEIEALTSLGEHVLSRERPGLQRLGYLLDLVEASVLARALHRVVFPDHPHRRPVGGQRAPLTEIVASTPEDIFWKKSTKGKRVPDFNAVFEWYLDRFYDSKLPSGPELARDIGSGKTVNLSTFQRVVATEAKRRRPVVPLRPGQPITGCPVDSQWQVAINEDVEADL